VSTHKNRRRNLRAPVSLPVAWRDVRRDEVEVSVVKDLSASGIAIRTDERVARGAAVYLAVGHESLGLAFEAAAHVVRTLREGEGYVVSLEFEDLAVDVAAAIGRFVLQHYRQAQLDGSPGA
jgi:c-di-GMP-binding flagellar brake protein YcgR